MGNRQLEGWLFDVDDLGPHVGLWVYTNDGRPVRLTEAFHPPVYAQGERACLKRLANELSRRGIISHVRWVERREFWSGESVEALELHLTDSSLLPELRRLAAARDREFTLYNCDIPVAQYYLYLKGLFPLCRLACEVGESGNVLEAAAIDSPWEIDYRLPSLSVLKMRGERMRPPNSDSRVILESLHDDVSIRLHDGAPAIEAFNAFIKRHDPDVILSEGGDALLIPALLNISGRSKLDLVLDRDRIITRRKIVTEGRTHFNCGRVIYKGPSYPLFGRWHIDGNNSFMHRETELYGLVELARLARIPVQRMARASPGSAISSMQMDVAIADHTLVPWRKSEPERYKTALELLTIDKGGLTFRPRSEAFEQVAEIDFESMYPSIMVRHNISPETVLCSCCKNSTVPEAGYNICEKRRGLIPRTLGPLLERRKIYKEAIKGCDEPETRQAYGSRQAAIKWMLVSCFGYLGYKNAKFGRIEAHEAVTAFGREKLLRAKEVAEAAGFTVLHALTDSLWIRREGAAEAEVLALCDQISRDTEVEMGLEGIYNWVAFLPSKENGNRPLANCYYGVFSDGKMKLRGLACRCSDTPQFIKDAQLKMLAIMAKAKTLEERAGFKREVEAVLRERLRELEEGAVDPQALLVRQTLEEEIDDYGVETRAAAAARQLRRAGIKVHAGEALRYIIVNARAKETADRVVAEELISSADYDAKEYIKLLKAAAREVLGSELLKR